MGKSNTGKVKFYATFLISHLLKKKWGCSGYAEIYHLLFVS